MCWLGDIGYAGMRDNEVQRLFNSCGIVNEIRFNNGLPLHTFLFLTKWPQNLHEITMPVLDNIWVGTSVTGQQNLTDYNRIDALIKIPSVYHWLSIEPLLDGDTFSSMGRALQSVSQVVVGAETGPGARPCNPDWIRSIRDQCAESGVPFFLKQVDKHHNRELDGRTHDDLEWGKR